MPNCNHIHTTATTHSFSLLLDQKAALDVDMVPVVAHELAHQWFSDLVTCRDWANGWLNEGFATYFEELWSEHDLGADWFKYSMLNVKKGYLLEDARYRRPVVYHVYYDQGFELFDGHLYNKGGWVLHMLRHQLGDATFRRAIKAYLERYREKEVITADLERTVEEVSGRSLGQFFQQWIYSGGYPALEVQHTWDDESHMLNLKIKQTQKIDDLTPCFVTPLDLTITVPTSDEAAKDKLTTDTRTIPLRVTLGADGQAEQSFYIPLERKPLMICIDPDGWLLKTLKFERPTDMLCYQLAHDPDVLGRIEAAESLGKRNENESFEALVNTLNNDAFWGVRVAAAAALGEIGTERAQTALIQALQALDPTQHSRVREAIVRALGDFQAPQQAELAQRSADALRPILEGGDVSYRVEASAAEALGKTRTPGSVEFLTTIIDRPSWMSFVQRGIFSGLGATGDDRAVDIIVSYLTNTSNHPMLRRAAAVGLLVLGNNRYLYSEEARQRAVTGLLQTVEHDSWGPARMTASMALAALGEKRAIEMLDRLAGAELDSGAQRLMRMAAHMLRTSDKSDEQLKLLRQDLDEVREENRKLREQLNALEAKVK